MTFGEQANALVRRGQQWSSRPKIDQLDMGRAGQDEIVWLYVSILRRLGRKTDKIGAYQPMNVSLLVTPVYGTYDLGCPP